MISKILWPVGHSFPVGVIVFGVEYVSIYIWDDVQDVVILSIYVTIRVILMHLTHLKGWRVIYFIKPSQLDLDLFHIAQFTLDSVDINAFVLCILVGI